MAHTELKGFPSLWKKWKLSRLIFKAWGSCSILKAAIGNSHVSWKWVKKFKSALSSLYSNLKFCLSLTVMDQTFTVNCTIVVKTQKPRSPSLDPWPVKVSQLKQKGLIVFTVFKQLLFAFHRSSVKPSAVLSSRLVSFVKPNIIIIMSLTYTNTFINCLTFDC